MTRFFIDQHGCAKNQTDGEVIVSYLKEAGFEHTMNPETADFIIINSCGFIESAKKESIDAVYSVKAAYPAAKIIMTGCLAQRYAQTLNESMPELDGVFGNGDLSKIVEFMKSVLEGSKDKVMVFPQEGICSCERKVLFNFKGSAFVKITEGCSNHCSFCAIPLIRGELRSRSCKDVIEEIKSLVEKGVYEINLIGQDLAAYGTGVTDDVFASCTFSESENKEYKNLSPLCVLLKQISKLEGQFLVRLLYIHPDHFNEDILPVIKADSRFARYFDIPFQSGDDDIIHAMNRKGSFEKYSALIKNIRMELENCVIRTTFLTGFPGETDLQAENTRKFLETIKPDWSGCFSYSREEDTPAYNMKPRVPVSVARKRAVTLEKIQSEITAKTLEKYIGTDAEVLVEEIIDIDPDVAEDVSEGLAIGRTCFQAPEVDGCVVIRYDRSDETEMNAVVPGNVVVCHILAVNDVDLDSSFVSLKKEFPKDSQLEFVSGTEQS